MSKNPAIAIGGVGGSGTRVIAQLIRSAGYYIGSDLNDANDNLWFALLFNRRDVLLESIERFALISALFFERMQQKIGHEEIELAREIVWEIARQPNPQHPADWLLQRAKTFVDLAENHGRQPEFWGWKSPPTHIVIDRLLGLNPNLRYIHVTRNGLDMAHSKNQNQLKMWGPSLGCIPDINPRNSLKYWCTIERRARALANRFPNRIKLVDFDQFCLDARRVSVDILTFCGKSVAQGVIDAFASTVIRPPSIGRFRAYEGAGFDFADVQYVASLGYPVAAE